MTQTLENGVGGGNTMITRFDGTTKVADVTPAPLTIDDIYPIGIIVCGAKPTVGTWEKVEGRFLLGSSSSYEVGSTGGEEAVSLSVNQMPRHNHETQLGNGYFVTIDDSSPNKYGIAGGSFVNMSWGPNSGKTTGSTGGSLPHTNMPPYLSVDMWRRIA